MTKKLVFILFIVFGFVVKAQIPEENLSVDKSVFPKEQVALSINSDILLAGELLQYKAFNLDASNKESKLSKVLYVSLRNQNDSVVFTHKLKVEKGVANGDFFTPSALQSGVYKLIGYTNYSRNNTKDAFAEKKIYIINSYVKTTEKQKVRDTIALNFASENASIPSEKESNTRAIKVKTNKNSYGFREKVTLKLESNLNVNPGNYVLSVRKVNPVSVSDNSSNDKKSSTSETFFVPELRGELISGIVRSNENGQPAANKNVSLTIPGNDFVFKIAKTNTNGRFFFSVMESYDAEKSIIQLMESEENAANYTLVIDQNDFNLEKSNATVLKLDPDLKVWLQERSVQVQIENAYFDVKKDSVLKNKSNPAFYDNLGTVFVLDDYTRFPSVRETFIEVVTLAAVRGSGKDARLIVNNEYDPNRTAIFNDLPPLVLMDGMQVQDNEDVINYSAREIESIRVIIQPYRYGHKVYSGIIAVETKEGDFVPRLSKNYIETIDLPPAVKKKKVYRADYSNNGALSRIPDYRVQLLWEPNINLSAENNSTSFYTSDVSGNFEITLEGFSDDGTFISAKNYFTVNKN